MKPIEPSELTGLTEDEMYECYVGSRCRDMYTLDEYDEVLANEDKWECDIQEIFDFTAIMAWTFVCEDGVSFTYRFDMRIPEDDEGSIDSEEERIDQKRADFKD